MRLKTIRSREKRRSHNHSGLCLALLATFALFADNSLAETETDLAPSRFELGGFGTLGVARTDTNAASFSRDQTQAKGIGKNLDGKLDSLLGIQAYFRATDSLEFVTQAISRYGPHGDFRPEISWAFGKYSIGSDNLVLRAGRMGLELYMLADSRHVGYSYLTVRPPVDFFGGLAFHYIDGIDLVGTLPLNEGVLKLKGFAGQANELAPINNGTAILSLRGNPIYGLYADYQKDHWQWRATYAQMNFKHDLPSPVKDFQDYLYGTTVPSAMALARSLSLTGTTSRFYSLGAIYDHGPLLVQAMLSQIDHESRIYQNTQAGYLITGYRIGEFTPFAAYSWSKSKNKPLVSGLPEVAPPPFPANAFADLNAQLLAAQTRVHTDQHTYTLGSRWDFRRNMALKAQVDFIRGKPESVFLYPITTGEFDGKMNVFSLALDFVF